MPVATDVAELRRNVVEDEAGQALASSVYEPFVGPDGACFVAFAEDGVRRCLPTSPTLTPRGAFADASCSTSFAIESCASPSDARWAAATMAPTDPTAPLRWRVFSYARQGDALQTLYTLDTASGSCTESGISARGGALTTPQPAARFPAMADVVERGEGRLRVQTIAGAQLHLRDAQLDVDCTLAPDGQGNRRCLPPGGVEAGVFADGACTRPALGVVLRGRLPAYVTRWTAQRALLDTRKVVGASLKGWQQRSGVCTPIPDVPGAAIDLSAPGVYVELGDDVPLETFASVP